MARVVVVHWNAAEIAPLVERVKAAGYDADAAPVRGDHVLRAIRENPPGAVVISLDRMPSHGIAIATVLRTTKSTRHVPIVFAGGVPEKVAGVREKLPDAVFAEWPKIKTAIARALAYAPAAPVVPKSKSGFDSGVPLLKKLGIGAKTKVALLGAPPEYESRFSEYAADSGAATMALWFVRSAREFDDGVDWALGHAPVLWIFWPKKTTSTSSGTTQFTLREACAERGWIDSKICAVDATWSGMRFTPRRF